jgi:hypothetical protein
VPVEEVGEEERGRERESERGEEREGRERLLFFLDILSLLPLIQLLCITS